MNRVTLNSNTFNGKWPEPQPTPLAIEAKKLFEDAQHHLNEIITHNGITAQAVFGLYPAVSTGDDIYIPPTPGRDSLFKGGVSEGKFLRFLRNQDQKEKRTPNLSLADFIAPESMIIQPL